MRTWIDEFVFNDTLYKKLKKAYLEAQKKGEEQFEIEGVGDFTTAFAKYTLQFVEEQRTKRKLKIYFDKK